MSYSDNYQRINWADYPETDTPLVAQNLNKMDATIKALSAEVARLSAGGGGGGGGGGGVSFPIGAIVLTVNNQNPGTALGGTWSQIAAGLALVGAGTGTDSNGTTRTFTAGQQQGEYYHTLSGSEMPSHSHSVSYSKPVYPSSNNVVNGNPSTVKASVKASSTSVTTGSAGSGSSHNNVQPSYPVYVWRRVA